MNENPQPNPEPARGDAPARIALTSVSKNYGSVAAVVGVDLGIRAGELFGLIGHNGAGKSTLFKLMLGLLPASAGSIRIDGVAVHGADFRAVRRRIGYLPENVVLYDNLTGVETLRFFAALKGVADADPAAVLARVGLADAGSRRVYEYSKGMRQRLGFAQALLGDPQLLFLDEPTIGLDPGGIRQFYAILRELVQSGVTVVLSSHILADIEERVDRLAILAAGRVRALGSVAELRQRLQLPLAFTLWLEPAALAPLSARLASLGIVARAESADRLCFECPAAARMAVLAAVSAVPGAVRDLAMREPSLEDLFFGLKTPGDTCY